MRDRWTRVLMCMLAALLLSQRGHAARTLEHEAIIPAPVADVWNSFATADGFMSWAVPKAEVDLRVGGEMRTSYNAESDLHDEHTIVNKVLAYEPERMLAMQNVQAPKGFANAHLFQSTWSVIYFEPTAPDRTHVRIVGMGYGEGPEWDDIYNKFKVGNAWTLEQLRRKFAPPEIAEVAKASEGAQSSGAGAAEHHPLTALDVVSRLVGGEWIHESTRPDGSLFRVRNISTQGPDGVSVVGRGWLGDADGMFDHGTTIIYREPGTPRTRFFNINEAGGISQGDVRAISNDAVEWDWNLTSLDGDARSFRVTMLFTNDDHYQFILSLESDEGEWMEMANLDFERVEEAPEAFRNAKAQPQTHD
jgi:uncharacterized protein YndB with AHSA1/START domain